MIRKYLKQILINQILIAKAIESNSQIITTRVYTEVVKKDTCELLGIEVTDI